MTTLILLGVYLTILIPLAWLGHRKAKRKTPHDFYLAGGSLGFLVLLCTLFATQYSGNTFMAFPAKAYRLGYAYVMSVGFMMAMVGFYCTYAPALRRRAAAHGFVTPGDWIHQRYQSTPFTILCAVLMIVAVLNYLLAQLMAMGHAMTELTGGMVGYTGGVLFLAFVVVIYESLGGMRAVVWTDTLQGLMMGVAVVILGVYLLGQPGLLAALPSRRRRPSCADHGYGPRQSTTAWSRDLHNLVEYHFPCWAGGCHVPARHPADFCREILPDPASLPGGHGVHPLVPRLFRSPHGCHGHRGTPRAGKNRE